MTTCKISEIISPAFYPLHRAVKHLEVDEVVAKGGRGSCKSSWASVEIVLEIVRNPDIHAVVFRKVGDTLRNSVYAQCCWAVSMLGLGGKFRCTVSPMEITYLPTGQKIFFLGLDDPGKRKSIKASFGYIGIAWFEELDQYAGEEEIRNVEQSVFRGGSYSLSIKTFNPPAAARNWANRYVMEQRDRRLTHHSTYLTTPKDWLGPRFISDAEYLKETNPVKYAHEYGGEVTGSGTEVFQNVRAETITTEQIANFDRRLHGVDWGWYPDPWAYNAGYYNSAQRTLYIYDELTRRRTSNQDTAALLIKRGLTWNDLIMADSAEPKSVGDYKAVGLHARATPKPPGSVEYSYKWLQSLNAIIIDPVRCPDTYKEFSECEYEMDKDGEPMEGYPDVDNHHIDAVRYMTQPIWKRRGE